MTASFRRYDGIKYHSSREPNLELVADVFVPSFVAPVLLVFHGWHGDRKSALRTAELFADEYVVVVPDMRGRGDSSGQPDVNGWELLDAYDAVTFVKRRFADRVIAGAPMYCLGGSGGGGNVYAMLGKFPWSFAAAAAFCGVSDYAKWYEGDALGEFRDDMDVWIGVKPSDSPSVYQARSGIELLENLHTPLLVYHGAKDARVPVEMARRYVAKARGLNKPVTYHELPDVGHDIDQGALAAEIKDFFKQHPRPLAVPTQGIWTVGGYLQTPTARVELPSLDMLAKARLTLTPAGEIRGATLVDCDPASRAGQAVTVVPIQGSVF